MKQRFEYLQQPIVRPTFETVYAVGLSFLRQSLRWLGVADPDLDDVLQEVMLAAYRGLDSFDPAWGSHLSGDAAEDGAPGVGLAHAAASAAATQYEPLKRWLFGIAWRQVSHYRARAYRRREVAVGAGARWPIHPADPSPSSEQLVASEQRSQLVSRLLATIDLDRRVVLIMYDLLEIPIADIAQELQLREITVRSRLRLAREEFRVAVKRMSLEERRALQTSTRLRIAELTCATDEEAILYVARLIPEVPAPVRDAVWDALQRAIGSAPAAATDCAPAPA